MGQQDVNVDLIKVGEKVEISDGQLIIKGVDGYERVSGYLRKEKAPAASKVGPQEGVFGFARRAAQEAQDKAKATPSARPSRDTVAPDEPDNSVQEETPLPDETLTILSQEGNTVALNQNSLRGHTTVKDNFIDQSLDKTILFTIA